MTPHEVKTPTWTQSDYGEPTASYSEAAKTPMFIGWINAMRNEVEGSIYEQYDFVGLTRADVPVGALIDDKYIVGYTDSTGRINRLFMNYAEGATRNYEDPDVDPTPEPEEDDEQQQQPDNS